MKSAPVGAGAESNNSLGGDLLYMYKQIVSSSGTAFKRTPVQKLLFLYTFLRRMILWQQQKNYHQEHTDA